MPQEDRRREDVPEHPEDDVRRILRELIPKDSRAEFIDHGSEKLVFKFNPPEKPGTTPNRQSIVYKVDYRESLFKNGRARDLHKSHAQEEARAEMQETVERRKQEVMKLREIFGYHAVPPERSSVQMLPMSTALYNAIKRHDMDALEKTPERIPALVTIQKRIELDPEKTADLTANYAETPRKREGDAPEIDDEAYENAHRRLIGDQNLPADREQALAECITMYPELQSVMERAEEDPAFQEQLRAAARGLVAYANRPEGTVLDVVGGHNMVIAQKPSTQKEGEHEWQLYLLDALSPDRTANINHLPDIAKRVLLSKGTSDDRVEALNIFHMVRMANALAMIAEIPDRTQLPKEVRDVPASMWRGFLNEAWSQKERAEASAPAHDVSPATRVAAA